MVAAAVARRNGLDGNAAADLAATAAAGEAQ